MNRFGVSLARAQRGGTVLGFVLGVLAGLAVALAVAVYVTKVPVPFVDRVISRKSSEDAAEAERNRNWDPNASLNGGRANPSGAAPDPAPAAVSAAPSERPELLPPPTKATQPMPAAGEEPVAAPAATASTPAAPKGKTYSSSPDPLGDLAAQQAQGKSFGTAKAAPAAGAGASASGPAESFMYFVQVGAYRTPEDAQSQRARLVLMGLDAAVTEREQGGRTVYRVRLGPFERQADAEKMKDTLEPGGFEAALVRVQR